MIYGLQNLEIGDKPTKTTKGNKQKGTNHRGGAPKDSTTAMPLAETPDFLVSTKPPPEGAGEVFTVVNSDGTTLYYTAAQGDGQGASNSNDAKRAPTQSVSDSDRVAASGKLKVRSKRTERLFRKMKKKSAKSSASHPIHLFDLPNEIILSIMGHLPPSDIFRFGRTCRPLQQLVRQHEAILSRKIISDRFSILEKCFRRPITLDEIDKILHERLQNKKRIEFLGTHRRYQHIPKSDPFQLCTCLTCVLRWEALCVVVDYNYWQDDLESGKPIPVIIRGESPQWNQTLLKKTTDIVKRAIESPLAYAYLLEVHLRNTSTAIIRQKENKGNRRPHFKMSKKDAESLTDSYLGGHGPATIDMPYHRDNYYMLEAYLPNRTWLTAENRWGYAPADIHDRDLDWVSRRYGPGWDDWVAGTGIYAGA
ncbi:hypothetical protein CCHL11_00090 [Colletotrichum chlorophyti]|uniref:F-box domain-containing protein n=1 Tax=Colletotrichum chlorophyti TaxID=708187 RepID=A0A1Q8RTY0_9PEZI|nr:hypothetical protein CCHL11_00090 [Colletotrichum chlorophyti]